MSSEICFREASPIEMEHWDELVMQFPNYQIFHMFGWVKSIEAFSGARALFLIGEQNQKIVACCPGLLYWFAGMRFFGSPREGWQTECMGPAFNPEDVTTTNLISSFLRFLHRVYRVIYIEISSRTLNQSEMRQLGFWEEPIPTLRTHFSAGGAGQMYKELDGKTRNQLRKSIKLGLVAKIGQADDFVNIFYMQLEEVFKRRKVALPFSRERVAVICKYLNNPVHLLPISVFLPDTNECIASGIFLTANHEAYLWGWAHRQEYGSYCPIELLTWTAMEIAMQRGCTSLDFGGLGKAKTKYNSVLDNDNKRWMISSIPGLIQSRFATRQAYRWQQKIRGQINARIRSKGTRK